MVISRAGTGWTKTPRSRSVPIPPKPEDEEKPGTPDNFLGGALLARAACQTHLFFRGAVTLAGVYVAFQVPISVFPETNFPRVVIGVDNGVMPVEQMQVTITKPIEDAVNSVPGLLTVRASLAAALRKSALFFDWNVDMFHTLQLDDAALATVPSLCPQRR